MIEVTKCLCFFFAGTVIGFMIGALCRVGDEDDDWE